MTINTWEINLPMTSNGKSLPMGCFMGFLPWEAIKDSLLEDIITKMREYPALYNKEMPEYKHGK